MFVYKHNPRSQRVLEPILKRHEALHPVCSMHLPESGGKASQRRLTLTCLEGVGRELLSRHQEVARRTVDKDVQASKTCNALLHPFLAAVWFPHIALEDSDFQWSGLGSHHDDHGRMQARMMRHHQEMGSADALGADRAKMAKENKAEAVEEQGLLNGPQLQQTC